MMARSGERIENPITGEEVVFRATAAETNGTLLRFDYLVPPRFLIAPPHVHRLQEERTEVITGRLKGLVGRRRGSAGPGSAVTVRPGVIHAWRNAGDEPVRAVVEFRPALRTEVLLRLLFELARLGATTRRGLPGPLTVALLAHDYPDETGMPLISRRLQRALFALPAAVAHRRGLGVPPGEDGASRG